MDKIGNPTVFLRLSDATLPREMFRIYTNDFVTLHRASHYEIHGPPMMPNIEVSGTSTKRTTVPTLSVRFRASNPDLPYVKLGDNIMLTHQGSNVGIVNTASRRVWDALRTTLSFFERGCGPNRRILNRRLERLFQTTGDSSTFGGRTSAFSNSKDYDVFVVEPFPGVNYPNQELLQGQPFLLRLKPFDGNPSRDYCRDVRFQASSLHNLHRWVPFKLYLAADPNRPDRFIVTRNAWPVTFMDAHNPVNPFQQGIPCTGPFIQRAINKAGVNLHNACVARAVMDAEECPFNQEMFVNEETYTVSCETKNWSTTLDYILLYLGNDRFTRMVRLASEFQMMYNIIRQDRRVDHSTFPFLHEDPEKRPIDIIQNMFYNKLTEVVGSTRTPGIQDYQAAFEYAEDYLLAVNEVQRGIVQKLVDDDQERRERQLQEQPRKTGSEPVGGSDRSGRNRNVMILAGMAAMGVFVILS